MIVVNVPSSTETMSFAFRDSAVANLVEADPVPGAGGEGLQRAVEDYGVDVRAPVAFRLQTYQRRPVQFPQLEKQTYKLEDYSIRPNKFG